jgi:hypothetical protein
VVLDLIKGFFCIYYNDQVVFVFASINMLHYLYKFAHVEPPLHPWDEADLVMVNDHSDMLLDLVCHYFIEGFFLHRCLLRRLACSSPFLDMSLSSFGMGIIPAL